MQQNRDGAVIGANQAIFKLGTLGLSMGRDVGRIGAVVSPFLAVASVANGGSRGMFGIYAALMLLSATAVAHIVRHIPPSRRISGAEI